MLIFLSDALSFREIDGASDCCEMVGGMTYGADGEHGNIPPLRNPAMMLMTVKALLYALAMKFGSTISGDGDIWMLMYKLLKLGIEVLFEWAEYRDLMAAGNDYYEVG